MYPRPATAGRGLLASAPQTGMDEGPLAPHPTPLPLRFAIARQRRASTRLWGARELSASAARLNCKLHGLAAPPAPLATRDAGLISRDRHWRLPEIRPP